MKIVCWLFGHKWARWVSDIDAKWELRRCRRCSKVQRKKVV